MGSAPSIILLMFLMQVDCCWREGKKPLSAEIQVQTPKECTNTTDWQVSRTKDGQKVRVHSVSKAENQRTALWRIACRGVNRKFFRTMASTAAKSLSVCGSKLDDTAQLFALKLALSLHFFIIFEQGSRASIIKFFVLKGVAVFGIN